MRLKAVEADGGWSTVTFHDQWRPLIVGCAVIWILRRIEKTVSSESGFSWKLDRAWHREVPGKTLGSFERRSVSIAPVPRSYVEMEATSVGEPARKTAFVL